MSNQQQIIETIFTPNPLESNVEGKSIYISVISMLLMEHSSLVWGCSQIWASSTEVKGYWKLCLILNVCKIDK